MPVRKVADIKIRTSSKGRAVVTGSGTKFYSYDKDSAAIDFHFFDQDGSPTDLLNSEIKLMLLTKESDNWKKFTIFDNDLEILSRIKGRARYIIPDTLRGYQGVVQGYVYLNFADGSRTDECNFTFTIERSKIEEEFENAGGYFIKEIQEVFDEVKEDLKNMRPQMETEIKDLQDGLDQVGTDIVDANAKIKDIQDNVEKYRGPKGNTGDASYTHVAWKMTDETFTPQYPGENMLVGSESEIEMVGNGAVNQLPANRYLYFGKASLTEYGLKAGDKLTFSAEYEISGTGFAGEFSFRLGSASWAIISPDQARIPITKAETVKIKQTIVLTAAMLGNTYQDSRLDNVPATVTIKVRKRKLEIGENLFPVYTPSKSVDYENAVPKYRGEYVDNQASGSQDPAAYTWTDYLGLEGPEGLKAINGDGQLVFNNKWEYYNEQSQENTGWSRNTSIHNVLPAESDSPSYPIMRVGGTASTTKYTYSRDILVVPGTTLVATVFIRSTDITTAPGSSSLCLRFYNETNAENDNSSALTNGAYVYVFQNGEGSKGPKIPEYGVSGAVSETNKWFKQTITCIVPEGYNKVKVLLYNAIPSTTAFNDYRKPEITVYQKGDSAYQVWLNQGNTGTESDFLNSFKVGYTKEESDQKFATKTSVLPTATDAEAITGAATNKLITPKNLQTFYEDRQKISVARFGLSDLDPTSVEKFSEASWRYRRTGNQVEFFGRFNFKVAGDSFSTVHTLPVGFRLSADFDDTSWNVPLSAAKFSSLSTYLAAGFVERMGTNFLKVASTTTGNVYFYGRWYTDDPFPLG